MQGARVIKLFALLLHRLFFRRHYPIHSVTFSSLDPQDQRWLTHFEKQILLMLLLLIVGKELQCLCVSQFYKYFPF